MKVIFLALQIIPLLLAAIRKQRECPIFECAPPAIKEGAKCVTLTRSNGILKIRECPKGMYCDLQITGTCKEEKLVGIGGLTNITTKCKTGRIVNNICRGIPLGRPCDGQVCDLGLYCSHTYGTIRGKCRRFKRVNDTCKFNYQCPQYATCYLGECVKYGSLRNTNDSAYLLGMLLCQDFYVNMENFTCGEPPALQKLIINGTKGEICNYTSEDGRQRKSRLFFGSCDIHRDNNLMICPDLIQRAYNLRTLIKFTSQHGEKAPVSQLSIPNYGFSPAQMNETGFEEALRAYCHLFVNMAPEETLDCALASSPMALYCLQHGGFENAAARASLWTWKSTFLLFGVIIFLY